MTIDPDRFSAGALERGVPTELLFSCPVKIQMEFASGTYIEGVIPANCGFTICHQGDITKLDLPIDKAAGLSVVEPESSS